MKRHRTPALGDTYEAKDRQYEPDRLIKVVELLPNGVRAVTGEAPFLPAVNDGASWSFPGDPHGGLRWPVLPAGMAGRPRTIAGADRRSALRRGGPVVTAANDWPVRAWPDETWDDYREGLASIYRSAKNERAGDPS